MVAGETKLSDQQMARVEALEHARTVISKRTGFTSEVHEVIDLYNIAQYIIDGKDPWPEPDQPRLKWEYTDIEEKSDGSR